MDTDDVKKDDEVAAGEESVDGIVLSPGSRVVGEDEDADASNAGDMPESDIPADNVNPTAAPNNEDPDGM